MFCGLNIRDDIAFEATRNRIYLVEFRVELLVVFLRGHLTSTLQEAFNDSVQPLDYS